MVRACLASTFAGCDEASLREWLKRDSPTRNAERGTRNVKKNAGTLILLPSTVFAAAWQSSTAVWLAGGSVTLKPSRREPAFAKLLAQSVKKIAGPTLPIKIEVGRARRARRDNTQTIIAYGKDETIEKLRSTAAKKIIGFGSMISLACVGKNALVKTNLPNLTRRMAWDTTLYDTQGCLSPQCVYVEKGGKVSPEQFAKALARAMRHLDVRLPRKKIQNEAMMEESFWQRWRFLESQGRAQIHDRRVIFHQEPSFEPCGLRRVIFIVPWRRISDVNRHVGAWRNKISTIATSDAITQKKMKRIFQQLFIRWCEVGAMHKLEPWWRNGGVSLLRRLSVTHSSQNRRINAPLPL